MYFICGKSYDKEPAYEDFHNMVKSLIFSCSKNKSLASKLIYNEEQYADVFADVVRAFYNYDDTKNSTINSWLTLQTTYAIKNTIRKFKNNPINNYTEDVTLSYNVTTKENLIDKEHITFFEGKYETIRGKLKDNKENLNYIIHNSGLSDRQIRDITLYSEGMSISEIARQNQEIKQTTHLRIKTAIGKIKANV